MSDNGKHLPGYTYAVGEMEAPLNAASNASSRKIEQKKISLCMIVKNEEAFLDKCLESVKDVADEMVVVDTGSTDKTVEIAKSHGAKVFYFPWNGSFSDARNFSIEHATGDWILILDADEVLASEDKETLSSLIQRDDQIGFLFRIKNITDEFGTPDYQEHFFIRLFPRHPDIRYCGEIHEQVKHRVKGSNGEYLDLPIDRIFTLITIIHYGYHRKVFSEKNKAERNIKILEDALSQEKQNAFHHFNLAVTFWCAGELEKAFQEYELARKFVNRKLSYYPMILLGGAGCLSGLGKGKQAIPWAKEAVERLSDLPDSHFCLASAYEAAGMYEEAIQEFMAAIECGPEHMAHIVHDPATATWKPWNQIGIVHLKMGKFDKAVEAFNKALEMKPGAPHLMHNVAFAHMNTGNYAEAEEVFKQLLSRTQDSGNFWKLLALYRKQGKHQEMLDLAERFVAEHPGEISVWGSLGFMFLQDGIFNLAKFSFKSLVERAPGSQSLNNLGAILMHLGEFKEALACFQEALKLEPAYLEARINAARCHIRIGEPGQACALLENFPEGTLQEMAFQIQAEAVVASPMCKEVMEKNCHSVSFLKKVAIALILKDRPAEAVPLLERLVTLAPEDPQVFFQAGMAQMKLLNHQNAVKAFSKALALNPDMIEVKAGLLAAQASLALNSQGATN